MTYIKIWIIKLSRVTLWFIKLKSILKNFWGFVRTYLQSFDLPSNIHEHLLHLSLPSLPLTLQIVFPRLASWCFSSAQAWPKSIIECKLWCKVYDFSNFIWVLITIMIWICNYLIVPHWKKCNFCPDKCHCVMLGLKYKGIIIR